MVFRTHLPKNSRKLAAGPATRLAKFGPPPIIEGEDAAAFYELLAALCDEVKPVGVVEEMFVYDVVCLEWDIVRFHRLRTSLMRAIVNERLKKVLPTMFDYSDLPHEDIIEPLAENLFKHVAKKGKEGARKLAHQYARDEPDAIEKVDDLLDAVGRDLRIILEPVREEKVKELTDGYARGELDAIRQVTEILAAKGLTVHDLLAEGLTEKIEGEARIAEFARFDRLISTAETRRNASLRMIDARRAVLGEAVRRTMQQLEADFKVIEMPSRQGKRAK